MPVAGAVDIGGTTTKIALVRDDATIVTRGRVPTAPGGDPLPLLDAIASQLGPMLDRAGREGTTPLGIGVSVAGFLDPQRTAMVENANLPTLCNFPLREGFQQRFPFECRLEVDSNAAAAAEYRYGAARHVRRVLGVTIGTGLGGAVIIDGRLLRYTGECAGDLGHIILDAKGPPCPCGARGCLEALVSSAAVARRANGRTVREIVTAARSGEAGAVTALSETGWWLGLGLASLAPLFAPDMIVVGGGVAAAKDLLLEPTRASFRSHAAPELARKAEIVGSSFEGWEGMLGAASLFLDPLP